MGKREMISQKRMPCSGLQQSESLMEFLDQSPDLPSLVERASVLSNSLGVCVSPTQTHPGTRRSRVCPGPRRSLSCNIPSSHQFGCGRLKPIPGDWLIYNVLLLLCATHCFMCQPVAVPFHNHTIRLCHHSAKKRFLFTQA